MPERPGRGSAGAAIARATLGLALTFALAGAAPLAPAQARRPRAHTAPKVHVSPRDAAATRAYLEADYAYVRANIASLPAARAALEALADRLADECPEVMKGAPSPFGLLSEGPGPSPSARRLAELSRERDQAGTLQSELDTALGLVLAQARRQGSSVFTAAVTPLSWSDPAVGDLVHEQLAELQEKLGQPLPDVCADMRAWVASGYRTLSPATKEYRAKQEARRAALLTTVGGGHAVPAPTPTLAQLLARYESVADKALLAKAQRIAQAALPQVRSLAPVEERLRRALGIAPSPRPQRIQEAPKPVGVTLARGKTAAGERFVVRLRRNAPHSRTFREEGCRLSLSIESTKYQQGIGNITSGETACLSRSGRPRSPSVNCNSGLLTVTLGTLPAARSVRMRLSDGHTIVSPVLFVPARLGGPAGYYYQVVRGPSPIPVSLAELDAHGRTLRTVALHRIVECTEHPVKYFPGGIRTLVHEAIPNGGPPFAIVGERYRFLGKVYFEVKLHIEAEGESEGKEIFFGPRTRALEFQIEAGCKPHPYTILYSLLKKPSDTVLSRTGTTVTPWRTVPIPADLHAGGVLVYTVLAEPPEEISLRAPDGHTVVGETLNPLATETRETCEGEAEG
jgi:hypothetical protein